MGCATAGPASSRDPSTDSEAPDKACILYLLEIENISKDPFKVQHLEIGCDLVGFLHRGNAVTASPVRNAALAAPGYGANVRLFGELGG